MMDSAVTLMAQVTLITAFAVTSLGMLAWGVVHGLQMALDARAVWRERRVK